MLQLVDSKNLIKGEYYCVKRHVNTGSIIIARDVMFVEYIYLDGTLAACKYKNNGMIYLFINVNNYYRYVSREEYLMKIREKYDKTCLDIVLKRLVNETFEW